MSTSATSEPVLRGESQNQIVRNMRSIGIDLEPWIQRGLSPAEESSSGDLA